MTFQFLRTRAYIPKCRGIDVSVLKYGSKRKIPTRTNTGEHRLLADDGKVWFAS